MRLVVRLVAVMLAGGALLSLYAVLVFGNRVGFTHILRFPGVTSLTIVLWIVTTIGGPIAAIQLWRFKRSGWTLGLIVFAVGLLYDTVGLVMIRAPVAHLPSIALNTT